jgi:hypothetical protein
MASFNGFVLTNKGRELLAKAVAGEQLTFTKMEVGDGTFTGDVKTLTALVSKKDDFNINQIENQGNGQVSLKAIISNKNNTSGYYIREIGIFAHGVDDIEILYAYNKAIEADYFPAFNSSNVVEVEYQNIIIVDQAQNITAVIDPSLTYLTKEEAIENYVEKGQIATETKRGITSGLDIRGEEAAYIIGAQYDGIFGSTLTEVEFGKTYYYWDSVKKIYTPYRALKTATKPTGFITPDVQTFVDISNTNSANIVYQDGPYTLIFNTKESVLRIHNDMSSPMYSLSTLDNSINVFCTQFGYKIPIGAFLTGFKVWKINNPTGVFDCYGIKGNTGWGFYAGENNANIGAWDYYFHAGEAHVRLVKI